MKPPVTYFEWNQLLDRFATGDDSVLAIMQAGEIKLDAGTVTRFISLIDKAYKSRKQKWVEQFNNSFRNQLIKNSAGVGVIVNQTKAGLRVLIQFAQLPPFPDDIKKMLTEDLDRYVQEIRTTLKANAHKAKNSDMNSMLIMFDNLDIKKINIVQVQNSPEQSPPWKRKIIF